MLTQRSGKRLFLPIISYLAHTVSNVHQGYHLNYPNRGRATQTLGQPTAPAPMQLNSSSNSIVIVGCGRMEIKCVYPLCFTTHFGFEKEWLTSFIFWTP